MSAQEIRRDLSIKLQADLGAVLERQMDLAYQVLSSDQVGLMLIEAAVMVVRTVSASIGTVGADAGKQAHLYDATVAAIVQEVARSRPEALRRLEADRVRRAA